MSVLEADSRRLFEALAGLLAEKGLVTPAEIETRVGVTDRASPALGAAMVARAWTDPAYRDLLVEDGSAGAEAAGISMAGMPPLGVLANAPGLHNVVVCTLCSCYPRAVLGYPPFWFKSPAYRARTVRDPRGVLRDWGTELPAETRIRVVDSTADYRWMVLPMRPAGTEGWSAERLAGIVRAGDMIGVTVPSAG